MSKVAKLFTLTALIVSSNTAFAQEMQPQGYLGLGYAFLTYEEDGIAKDFDLGALGVKSGAKLTPYFAIELRAGFGVDDESVRINDVSAKLELDYFVGGYLLAGLPNETPFFPYVVVGMTRGELTATASGPGGYASISESESDFSYGAGADFSVTEQFLVNAEYMNYIDKDGVEVTGPSIGVTFLF